uniref:zinc finger domain-containing protein n=1 Tax=Isoptericola rhizosphaerae TaxID=3377837 RepID=UPI00383BABF4
MTSVEPLDRACPYCEAPPGQPCVTRAGRVIKAHHHAGRRASRAAADQAADDTLGAAQQDGPFAGLDMNVAARRAFANFDATAAGRRAIAGLDMNVAARRAFANFDATAAGRRA